MKPSRHSSLSRRVLKVLSLFSGLQIFSILCSIIKMKLVAMWLHASGVGLFGIYQTAIDTIATLTDMGLRQSATRDVAQSASSPSKLAFIAKVVRRWSMVAGLLGAVVISTFAPLLGEIFFDSPTRCWGFIALSIAMFLNSLVGGEQALLQGSGQLRSLAKGSLYGSLAGLALSAPMFYFWREASVVPSIIVYSLGVVCFTLIFRFRSPQKSNEALGLRNLWQHGKAFVRLGICLAIATFITNLCRMALLSALTALSDISTVGYFQAGDTLVTRYIGLIFTAIGVEFYPRIAAYASHLRRMRIFVNHEIQLLLLIVTPVICLFLLFRPLIIDILYTPDFATITTFISLAAIGCVFKVLSYCMAFTIIAKGDGQVYIITEALDSLIGLAMCLIGYVSHGLTGIGVAYLLWNLVYALIVGFVYYRRYRLSISRTTSLIALFSLLTTAMAFAAVEFLPVWTAAVFIATVTVIALLRLRRLM